MHAALSSVLFTFCNRNFEQYSFKKTSLLRMTLALAFVNRCCRLSMRLVVLYAPNTFVRYLTTFNMLQQLRYKTRQTFIERKYVRC